MNYVVYIKLHDCHVQNVPLCKPLNTSLGAPIHQQHSLDGQDVMVRIMEQWMPKHHFPLKTKHTDL